MIIKPNSILLFQGDSVTDCYRDRLDDSKLGNSYVPMIYEYLKQYNIKVINRAIAGNKVNNLLDRFDKDFKDVKPDNLILLIGVNDTWHDFPNPKSTIQFKSELDLLLSKVKHEMHCNVMLLEPFILGFKEEYIIMRDDLNTKIEAIKELAIKYNCEYLSFEKEFSSVITKENEEQYSIEGIHPLPLGYKIMAAKIIENLQIEEDNIYAKN